MRLLVIRLTPEGVCSGSANRDGKRLDVDPPEEMSMTRHLIATSILFSLLGALAAVPATSADDWPTFRHDPARSGVTPEPLSTPLHIQWTYEPKHPPQPAWPEPGKEMHRMPFDYAYQVAVAGGMVYFGSSADHRLHALDAATGEERWSFFTDAPIRFSPMVYEDRVLVTSDDGHLYCLSADRGKLLWKFRGGPRDERLIGNEHLISHWPMRTGVVVVDGIAYVTAGMWPAEGVYVYALRVADGSLVWTNDSSGSMYIKLPHPTAEGFSGVAPQGDILASGKTLLVPTGRSVPAGFDLATGRFLYYEPAWPTHQLRQGGSWVTTGANLLFCGSHPGGPDIDVRLGEAPPAPGDGLMAWDVRTGTRRLNLTGKHRLAVTEDAVYASGSGNVSAYEVEGLLSGKKPAECTRWQTPHGRAYSLIVAGDTVLVGGQGTVSAMAADTGAEVWQARVLGQARGLAAADGRLIVSTGTGEIVCFGAQQVASPQTVSPETDPTPYPEDELTAACAVSAERIIGETDVKAGYCLVVGAGEGRLAYELAKRTELAIYGVEPNAGKVAAARQALDSAGFYGVRVTVHQGALDSLPHPEYFADLVVIGEGSGEELSEDAARELYRVLRPCGGVAYLTAPTRRSAVSITSTRRTLSDAGVPREEIRTVGSGVRVVRGELPGAGAWTHQYAGPGRTSCSTDERVKWPLKLLWFGEPGPARILSRHLRGPAPLSVNGRLFIPGEDTVTAISAYNGRELWCRDLRSVARRAVARGGGNVAVDDDSVYAAVGSACLRLDAETGDTRQAYTFPTEAPRYALDETQRFELRVDEQHSGTVTLEATDEGLLATLVTVDDNVVNAHRDDGPAPGQSWEFYFDTLIAVDGKVRTPPLGDSWELYFDFRPAAERGGLYGAGAFQFVVVPATDEQPAPSCKAAVGPAHPQVQVSGAVTETGSETTVAIPWAEIEGLADGRPADFVFGVTLNASDDGQELAGRAHCFASPDSYRLTNGWATFVLEAATESGAASEATTLLPAEIVESHVWGLPLVTEELLLGTAAPLPQSEKLRYWGSVVPPAESEYVFALDKRDGRPRWCHRAAASIAHTAIAMSDGLVFLIDRPSQAQLDEMKRRGETATGKTVLVALDADTGEVVWQTEEGIAGRNALYATEGVVLAGSNQGLTAYTTADGQVVWTRNVSNRPHAVVALDTVYAEPYALDLKTGEPVTREHPLTRATLDWSFRRAYGCGGVSAAPKLLFFRSGALGFCDLAGDTGTHNFGGVRPGCHINAIAANGLALVPEGTSACTCAYNFQTSVALVPTDTRNEDWSVFSVPTGAGTAIRQLRLNLGATGDRRDADGEMWLGFPRPIYTGAVPVPMFTEGSPDFAYYRHNADDLSTAETDRPWLYASGCRGLRGINLDLVVEKPLVAAPCQEPPTIDGTLNDACWDGRYLVPLVDEQQNRDSRTTTFLRNDADNLYIAFSRQAPQRNGEPVPWKAGTAGEDAPVWTDDSWQVFLTDSARKTYLRLGVSASGARYDAKCTYERTKPVDTSWNGQWISEVSTTPDAWTVEIAVPWETFAEVGLDQATCRMNILGMNYTGVGPERVQLRYPGSRDFDRCELFSSVALDEPAEAEPRMYTLRLHFARLDDLRPGKAVFDVQVQGEVALEGFDVAKPVGAPGAARIEEIEGVEASGTLNIEFVPRTGSAAGVEPALTAIEVYERG